MRLLQPMLAAMATPGDSMPAGAMQACLELERHGEVRTLVTELLPASASLHADAPVLPLLFEQPDWRGGCYLEMDALVPGNARLPYQSPRPQSPIAGLRGGRRDGNRWHYDVVGLWPVSGDAEQSTLQTRVRMCLLPSNAQGQAAGEACLDELIAEMDPALLGGMLRQRYPELEKISAARIERLARFSPWYGGGGWIAAPLTGKPSADAD